MKIKIPATTTRIFPTIYKNSSTGAQLYWFIEVKGACYRSFSGQTGGTEKVSAWTECVAQNVGKSNERSPSEQAYSAARNNYDKKLRHGGYVKMVEQLKLAPKFLIPMLAHKYTKGMAIPFPTIAQPKYNGVRCVASWDGNLVHLKTRNGEPIVSCPHINRTLCLFYSNRPTAASTVFDGELYNHALREELNQLVSLVRKQTPSATELADSAKIVQFHYYDCYDESAPELSHGERRESCLRLYENTAGRLASNLYLCPDDYVKDQARLEEVYKRRLEEGYEGLILRDPSGTYEHKRSKNLLKYKPRYDFECKVEGAEEGKGKRKGMAAKLLCRTPKGVPFKANLKWSDERKREILVNIKKYKLATVSYAYITEYGKPFHNYVEALYDSAKRPC